MKKAICHYSFHRCWEKENWSVDRLAGEVRRLGVEGIDFHVRFLGALADPVREIRSALVQHGLTLSGLSMSNNFYQANPEDFKMQVETVKRWIPVAGELQAPVSRIFGGYMTTAQYLDPAVRAQGKRQVLDGLGQVVREAEKYGVTLGLENHGGLPCTGQEQVKMIETIASPNLKAVIDVGNYLQGGQEGHVGTQLALAYAAYVHFKDFKKISTDTTPWGWNLQACIVGQGDVDHRECLKVLRQAGYSGFVALEYEGPEDEAIGVPESVKFMTKVM